MKWTIREIAVDYGNTQWGAESGKKYFVIRLGERVYEDI